jgi:soluble lytic murein transglycosylase-like protein
MSALNINIPAIPDSYYSTTAAKANEGKIKTVIRPKFGAYINNISKLSDVPAELIESFIFIESGGNPNAKSPYATGLMQLSPATASDVLVKEKGADRLRDGEAAILKKYLGTRYSLIEKVKPKQTSLGKTFITNDDLLKPEFNILVGSILLGQLVNEFTENGILRLDKVVTIYNGGRFSKAGKKIIKFQGSTKELLTQVPKESSNYILKLLGTQGLLDTIV